MSTYIGKFEEMDVNLDDKELEDLLRKILSMTLDEMLNKSYR